MEQTASASTLAGFQLERVLDQDARMHSASLLGSLPIASSRSGSSTGKDAREPVIVNIEKTHFAADFYAAIGSENGLAKLADLGQNDIYTWLLGWFAPTVETDNASVSRAADVKITLIRPATETHILKYSAQAKYMVRETPEMYRDVVRPWIQSQPPSRINWVYNILDKIKEKEGIIYEDPDPKNGFIIVPDLKWDQSTLSSLYLVAIVHDRSLRSLRDLTPEHLTLLRAIRDAAERVAADRFGVVRGAGPAVRCFLHYQPTYYHLHVHILHASFVSSPGAIVGQAHLLDDVIDLLELGVDFQKRTLTYALSERHELWDVLSKAGTVPAGPVDLH